MIRSGFRAVLAADMVSTFGSMMSRLAIPWLAVLTLGAGPAAMAWLAVADVAASAVAALFAGAPIDRLPKRATMIVRDLLRAGALIFVAVLAAFDRLTTGVLGLVFALGGLGSLAGSWLAARFAARIGSVALLCIGLAVWAVGSACAPLAVGAGIVALALLCTQQIVGDAGATVFQIHDRTLRQRDAPADHLARVDAGLRALGHGCTLAGALAGGAAAELLGTRALLFASAAVLALAAVTAWWTLLRPRAMAVA